MTFCRFQWLAAAAALLMAALTPARAQDTERLVHRFLHVDISADARWVVSVEGDSPPSGYSPPLRELVIRRAGDGAATTVVLPCGHVPQCWPDFPTFTPDGKHVSFTLRSPGSHARALYTVATDGSGLAKVLDFNGTLVDLRYLSDGRLAMLATADATKEVGATEAGAPVAGDLDAPPPEQRIAVLERGSLRFVSPPDLFVYEWDWRGAGKGFVGTASPGDGDNHWWVAKLFAFADDGAARVLYTPVDGRQQLANPRVSHDGSTVAFIGGIMSDFGSTGGDVYSLSVDGGAAINLTPDLHASATAISWNCDGHLRAELLRGDKAEIADLGHGKGPGTVKVLWSGEESLGDRSGGMPTACPSGIGVDEHRSFGAPPELQIGRVGQWQALTHVNAGLPVVAKVKSIWWKSDGFDVQGWLLLPPNASGKLPLITSVHGGPAAAETPAFVGPGTTRQYLERGYAVFWPNPRGSFGQGERFAQANVRDLGYGDLRDILAGIDAAARVAPIDLNRLGLTGGSYGGFMSMWAVTQTDRFKAVVAAAGISDWLSYYGQNGIDGWMIPYFGASAYDDPAIYAKSSAIHFMHNVKTPTFAWVGERDIECPAPQTQEFWHAMKAMNVPTAVMIYPGEGHGLRDPAHLQDATSRTLAWFDRYLK